MRFDPDDDEESGSRPDLEEVLDDIDRVSTLLLQAGKAYDDDTWKQFDKGLPKDRPKAEARQLDTLGIRSPFGVWPSLAA